jgi:hypothetical protein
MGIRLLGTLAATAVCLALTACGSGVGGGTSTTGSNDNGGLAFSRCMRSHGLSQFPDPGGSSASQGSGLQVSILGVHVPSTINIHAPAFKSAMQICIKKATGGNGPPKATAAQRRAALDFSRCMRHHGVPNFPDPVFKNGGIGETPPAGISPNAPALLRAQKICGNP